MAQVCCTICCQPIWALIWVILVWQPPTTSKTVNLWTSKVVKSMELTLLQICFALTRIHTASSLSFSTWRLVKSTALSCASMTSCSWLRATEDCLKTRNQLIWRIWSSKTWNWSRKMASSTWLAHIRSSLTNSGTVSWVQKYLRRINTRIQARFRKITTLNYARMLKPSKSIHNSRGPR